MNTFWLFLGGAAMGSVLFYLAQLFPEHRVVKLAVYTVDIFLCFYVANLFKNPRFFTSFILGAISVHIVFTMNSRERYPFVIFDNSVTRLPYSDPTHKSVVD
jgi:hypothetical protein